MHAQSGRVYEWALYVPQEEIANQATQKETIAIIKLNIPDPNGFPMLIDSLKSLAVTPESLGRYLSDAYRELSEDATVPPHMNYWSLLNLAMQVRKERGWYEDFAKEVKEVEETSIGRKPEPVEVTPANEPQ